MPILAAISHICGLLLIYSSCTFNAAFYIPLRVQVLIMASDGLWEFISNQEALDMIKGITDPKKAVDILVTEAGERWMKEEQVIDDTTVIVAFM